jgi:hypothetical protein
MFPFRPARIVAALAACTQSAGVLPAGAQEILTTGPLTNQDSYVPSPSSKASSRLLLPAGTLEVGGDLVVVMSKPVLGRGTFGGRQLDFSDAALLRLRARHSLGWVEVFTATEVFAKQPEYLDEPFWQASRLGARIPFGEMLASTIVGAVGQQQGYPGLWWQVEPSLGVKPELTRYVYAELSLGTSHRWFSPPPLVVPPVPTYALQELTAGAELAMGRDTGGGWIGVEYRVPFASGPARSQVPAGQAYLEPGPQLSFQVGGVASSDDGWEFFAYYSIIDRGDLLDDNTQLPVFNGGFDQQQLTLGVQYRFGGKRHVEDSW